MYALLLALIYLAFINGFVTDRLGDRRMIAIGTCIIVCGITLVAGPAPIAVSIAGFVVIGLGCAPYIRA